MSCVLSAVARCAPCAVLTSCVIYTALESRRLSSIRLPVHNSTVQLYTPAIPSINFGLFEKYVNNEYVVHAIVYS